jgi:dinuclear metal center YbgI/SA1388 family protein
MPRLADVIEILDALYPPHTAADWDAVGLVVGDPDAEVGRIVFAVDPVAATVGEAIEAGADLLLTHHPLFLRGVHGVPGTTAKGRLVHRLIASECALFTAHTNADVASPGVSDCLAARLGLTDVRILAAPDESSASSGGTGGLGYGRVGVLDRPTTLRDLLRTAVGALPETASGLRAAGDPDRLVRTVAVCGGAGDAFLAAAVASGADVYLTADLRHHPASEHGESSGTSGPALIDAPHWASERPWLDDVAARLRHALERSGATVECLVSDIVTDPWTMHAALGSTRGGDRAARSPDRPEVP